MIFTIFKYCGLAILIIVGLQTPAIAAEMSPQVPLELEKPSYMAPWKRYSHWKPTDWKDYSNLMHKVSLPVSTHKKAETSMKGDPENGKKLAIDRKRGSGCVACHILPGIELPGNIGPDLSMIGKSGRTDDYLFNYIYDARQFNPATSMPPWGQHNLFAMTEIKDMVAYLQTLTQPTEFETLMDDPAKRPPPVEIRENLDPFENPGMFSVDLGKKLFETKGTTGKSCQSCHTEPQEFTTWAVTMPKFETRLNKIIGIEEFVTRHALVTTGAEYMAQSPENLGLAIYLRYLANGQAIAIDQSDANTIAAIKRGKMLTERKIGQLNLACGDCHVVNFNKWIRGQYLVSMVGMYDHFPTYRTSRSEVWDIRKRFQWCGVAIRANELPPDAPEYGDLEIYLATLNNGRILSVPGIRH